MLIDSSYSESSEIFFVRDDASRKSAIQAAYHLRASLAFLAAVIPLESVFSRSSLEGTRPRVRSFIFRKMNRIGTVAKYFSRIDRFSQSVGYTVQNSRARGNAKCVDPGEATVEVPRGEFKVEFRKLADAVEFRKLAGHKT